MTNHWDNKKNTIMTEEFNIEKYKEYLVEQNLSKNSVKAYLFAVKDYRQRFKSVNKNNLLSYKSYLIDEFNAKTAQLRILAINKYLDYIGKSRFKLKGVKVQQRTYLENVISMADYLFFKEKLKEDKDFRTYFSVRFLAATGARISELVQLKIEHVRIGYFDLYSKGGKVRRLFIPKNLREEAMEWFAEGGRVSGYIFKNMFSQERVTPRAIGEQLKRSAKKYGLNLKVVYPHSFRHLFAKNFLEAFNDISLLADLMGHDNIETTRIYLRKTSTEQQAIVDTYVTW